MIFKKKKSYAESGVGTGRKGEGNTLKNIERYLTSFAFLLVVLIALYVMNLPGGAAKAQDDSVKHLEQRLAVLEEKVQVGNPDRGGSGRKMIEGLEAVTIRCERLEGALSLRGEAISRRMDKLESEIDALRLRYESEESKRGVTMKKNTPLVKKKSRVAKAAHKKRPVYHSIKPGETFYSISKKYGISLDQLQRLNGLTSKSLIYPGQKLLIDK